MAEPKKPSAHWPLVVGAIVAGAAAAAPFVLFGQPGNGRTVGFLAAVLFGAAGLRWQFRRRPWFWAVITFVAVAECPLVIFIHWTNRWIPAAAILPFAVADGLGILFLIDWISKLMDPTHCRT